MQKFFTSNNPEQRKMRWCTSKQTHVYTSTAAFLVHPKDSPPPPFSTHCLRSPTLGPDFVDPNDPTAMAERELLGAANQIEAAARKLALLRPRKSAKVGPQGALLFSPIFASFSENREKAASIEGGLTGDMLRIWWRPLCSPHAQRIARPVARQRSHELASL